MGNETILSQLPGSAPNERVLICLHQSDRQWHIGLRQQHWAEGIGWYDQKVLRLDPRQWAAFRGVFGSQLPVALELPEEPVVSIPFPGPEERDRRQALSDHA